LAEFNTATVVAVHQFKFMQRAFPPQPANVGKKKTQGAAAASINSLTAKSILAGEKLVATYSIST
jgi:hypothetical protein